VIRPRSTLPKTVWPERLELGGPSARSHTELEHLERYRWASARVSGRILDAACGTGYGTAMLASKGSVTGVDYDDAALVAARTAAPLASIVKVTLPNLPFPDHSFDYVVSFETVEHIDDAARFIKEIRRVLAPHGALLMSTPNGHYEVGTNPWHVREYVLSAFLALLTESGFHATDTFGQRTPPELTGPLASQARRLMARFPILCRPGAWWDDRIHGSSRVLPSDQTAQPLFWVVSATKPA
jgi:2-polyprenyl-3-methyl-5-hydroxy-6-metoxy-1,4-benzoquinol methylase